MSDEAAAVRRFKAGDPEAFDMIYASYFKPIRSYIYKAVNDKPLADDLTQETLIKIFKGLKDVDEARKLSPWIFRIARNTCVDYYRKSRVNADAFNDNMTCSDMEAYSPEYRVLNKEKQSKIKEALFGVSRKYKTALLLRDFDNLSYKEIASRLKLSEAAVKTLIYRARQQFQKVYAEVY